MECHDRHQRLMTPEEKGQKLILEAEANKVGQFTTPGRDKQTVPFSNGR